MLKSLSRTVMSLALATLLTLGLSITPAHASAQPLPSPQLNKCLSKAAGDPDAIMTCYKTEVAAIDQQRNQLLGGLKKYKFVQGETDVIAQSETAWQGYALTQCKLESWAAGYAEDIAARRLSADVEVSAQRCLWRQASQRLADMQAHDRELKAHRE